MTHGEVERHLAALEHPLAPALVALCRIVREVDPRIEDEVKWNAPSFRITDHFATTNLRPKGPLLLVLHAGARKRGVDARSEVADPQGLLEWKSPDRAVLTFGGTADVARRAAAVQAILRDWIAATQ